MGLEGLIGKRVDRPYTEGRSPDWIKVKCLQRQEFVVGGISRRAGAAAGISSLLLGVYERDGGFRFAGSVNAELRPRRCANCTCVWSELASLPFSTLRSPSAAASLSGCGHK